MTMTSFISKYVARLPHVAVGTYLMLILGLLLASLLAVMAIFESSHARDDALDKLARMHERERALLNSRPSNAAIAQMPPGSPFLEGQSVTLASANLLQRIAGAITAAGGSLESSEIESQESADGLVKAIAIFEIGQEALQRLLYDIEAGMPFLFVDQLVVHVPSSGDVEKMRVSVQISGQWLGTK
jgi:general secretion pathway protein M